MADTVIDVVTRLSFESAGENKINSVTAELQKQVQQVSVLTERQQRLQQLFNNTSANEIEKRARISKLIQTQTQRINEANQAIDKEIRGNKELQAVLTREIGVLNLLDARYKQLINDRNRAGDVSAIRAINRELQQVEQQRNKLTNTRTTGLGSIGSSILQGFGIGTGIGLLTQGIGLIKNFAEESSRLAAETEGVKRGFDALNQPDLLNNLRTATRGTVSDLELMKQAVQFSNFGLPLNQLASGLEFARRRAAQTGQSVDYLVQSIVTGVGRQSPLILDNLGISAKRVSEEFKKTGNFAEAAFKIIQEETKKAGADLETYAEQQAALNATLENQQAIFGKNINVIKQYGIAFLNDVLTGNLAAADPEDLYVNKLSRSLERGEQIQKEASESQALANDIYIKEFKRFNNDFTQEDLAGRNKIKQQAAELNNVLLEQSRQMWGTQTVIARTNLNAISLAYQQFLSGVQKQPINLNAIDPNTFDTQARNLSLEELQQVKEAAQNRSALNSTDTAIISKYNKISQIADKYIRIIEGTKSTGGTKKEKTLLDLIIPVGTNPQAETDPLGYRIEKLKELSKILDDVFKDRPNAPGTGIGGDTAPSGNIRAIDLELAQDIGRKQREDEAEERERREKLREQRLDAETQLYADIQTAAFQVFDAIYAKQLLLLDQEIAIRQDRVDRATEIAERGNVAILESERNRLNKAQEERERIAKRQLQINSILQASNAAVALTEAIGAVVKAAAQGDPYTIALRIASAVAALVAGVASLSTAFSGLGSEGFAEGVIDYKGKGGKKDDKNLVRISRGESVMTAEATERNRDILKMMNKGYSFNMPQFANPTVSNNFASKVELKGVEKKLDALIHITQGNRVSVKQTMDSNGLSQVVQHAVLKDQFKFR